MDQTLGLVEPALSGMRALQVQFPALQFISGKRDITDEAKDIVADGVKLNADSPQTGTIQYVSKTYKESPVKNSVLMALKGANDDVSDCIAAIAGALNTYSPDQLKLFSLHLSGLALDSDPMPAQESAIRQFAETLPGFKAFLTTEAGLPRWHFEWTQEGQPSLATVSDANVAPAIPPIAPGQQGYEQFHTPPEPFTVEDSQGNPVPGGPEDPAVIARSSVIQDAINYIAPQVAIATADIARAKANVAAIVSAIAPKPVEPPHTYATAVDTHVAIVQAAAAKKAAARTSQPTPTTQPKKKDNTTIVLVGLGALGIGIAMRGKL